jgi:protein gp37
MGARDSHIEWTGRTWDILGGCDHHSTGCLHCWSETLVGTRFRHNPRYAGLAVVRGDGRPHWTGEVRLFADRLPDPLSWTTPSLVFVASQSDLFHDKVPLEFIAAVFGVMALAGHHTYQVLTKRIERAQAVLSKLTLDDCMAAAVAAGVVYTDRHSRMVAAQLSDHARFRFGEEDHLWPLRNVWVGTSVENQAMWDRRIPVLKMTPAACRWASVEPLVGSIDPGPLTDLNWIVVGGESGEDARPMHPQWVRTLRDACLAASTSFYFKQWGAWWPWSQHPDTKEHYDWLYKPAPENDPDAIRACRFRNGVMQLDGSIDIDPADWRYPQGAMHTFRVGKSNSGAVLDGQTWTQFPEAHHA